MSKYAVIVLHYKNISDTVECLDSIFGKKNNRSKHDIILVANNPQEKTIPKIRKKYPAVQIISNKKNLGFAEGMNIGIREVLKKGNTGILILNNDTIISENFIDNIFSYAKLNPDYGIISPKIYFAPGYEYHKERYKREDFGKVIWYAGGKIDWQNVYPAHIGVDKIDRGQFDEEKNTDFATGCCMYIKRETIKKIGFLNKKYFLYFEDVDYCVRAANANIKVMYYPKLHIWHKNAASSGSSGSKLHEYYQTRNRLYFGLKYAPIKTKKSLILESIRFALTDSIKKKAVFDYYLGRMGKGIS